MRDQRYSQGFITILGHLVVLSVFMLVFGAITTMAKPGQAERCSEYTKQAKGLCTAAVANGCFDGEESRACDNLAANWNERCRNCEGEPPWLGPVTCPCADEVAAQLGLEPSADALYTAYLNEEFEDNPESVVNECIINNEEMTLILARVPESQEDFRSLTLFVSIQDAPPRCRYGWQGSNRTLFNSELFIDLSEAQLVACRNDVGVVRAKVGCP